MSFFEQVQIFFFNIKLQGPFAFEFLAMFWIVHACNILIGYRLNYLGIWPRRVRGLLGIITSPVLHANFNHLFFNSFPLFILTLIMLMKGPFIFIHETIIISILSGILIWLFGRNAIHIGASSLIMGYWGYLFTLTYEHPNILSILLIAILLYYFGIGFVASLLPSEQRVSWEGHLFGFISGIIVAYYGL